MLRKEPRDLSRHAVDWEVKNENKNKDLYILP